MQARARCGRGKYIRSTAVPVANTWLSGRQHQVMTLYSRGRKRADIAQEIGISDRTVDSHVRNTLIRLGARSIHEAVAIVAVSNAKS